MYDVEFQFLRDASLLQTVIESPDKDYDHKDYTNVSLTVIFPAGTTTALMNITIVDDNTTESTENFTFTIDPDSLRSDISIGSPYQTSITILDNDRKWMFNNDLVRGCQAALYVV